MRPPSKDPTLGPIPICRVFGIWPMRNHHVIFDARSRAREVTLSCADRTCSAPQVDSMALR